MPSDIGIEDYKLEYLPDSILLQWKMTVASQKPVWPHEQLEVHLFCDPVLHLDKPKITFDPSDMERTHGGAISAGRFGIGAEKSETLRQEFYISDVGEDKHKREYASIKFNLKQLDLSSDDARVMKVFWQTLTPNYLELLQSCEVRFGETRNGEYEPEIVFSQVPALIESKEKPSPLPSLITGTTDRKIFISYARKDGRELAARLRQQLKPQFDIWQDVINMPVGDNWWAAIREAIDVVDVMVLVLSDRALEPTSMVRREWTHARSVGTTIMPITLDADIFDRVPRWMSKHDVLILAEDHPDYEVSWARFIKQLHNPPPRRPIPFMALPLPEHFTEREAKQNELKQHLLDDVFENPRFATIAMQGAGGFGKTTLAQAICHDPDVVEAFDGGVLWATIGEDVKGLTEKINAMIRELTGINSITYSDQHEATLRLQKELKNRDCLMVLDDVWDATHIKSFPTETTTARLITTRDERIAEEAAGIIVTSQMGEAEAVQVLINWLPDVYQPSKDDKVSYNALAALANRLGEWPLLLRIIGAGLRTRVNRSRSLRKALDYVNSGLDAKGLTAFDRMKESDRNAALEKSMNASLDRFEDDEKRRLYELAIFPEDTAVTETVTLHLWNATEGMSEFEASELLGSFAGQFFEMRAEGADETIHLRIHDAMRLYLRQQLGIDWPKIHAIFLKSFNAEGKHWSEIANDPDGYLYSNLTYHLLEAVQTDDLHRLLTDDDRWLQTQFKATAGNAAYVADLQLAIDTYRDPLDADGFVRLAQLWAGRSVIHGQVTSYSDADLEVLVWLGREDEALGYARLRTKLSELFDGLMAIHGVCRERALKESKALDNGLLVEARAAAEAIPDKRGCAAALSNLAGVMAQAGDPSAASTFTEARAAVEAIPDDEHRAAALSDLAGALAQAGQYAEARAVVAPIPDEKRRAAAMSDLAGALAQAGQYAEARAAAEAIPDEWRRTAALSDLAGALAQAGLCLPPLSRPQKC